VDQAEKKDISLKFYDSGCFHIDLMFFPEILGVKRSVASKKLGKKFATEFLLSRYTVPYAQAPILKN
jgi:hypothetical protein